MQTLRTLPAIMQSYNYPASGNLRIHADKAITAQISGSGSVIYSGDATVASKVSGSGKSEESINAIVDWRWVIVN